MVDVEWYEKKRAGRDVEIAMSGVSTLPNAAIHFPFVARRPHDYAPLDTLNLTISTGGTNFPWSRAICSEFLFVREDNSNREIRWAASRRQLESECLHRPEEQRKEEGRRYPGGKKRTSGVILRRATPTLDFRRDKLTETYGTSRLFVECKDKRNNVKGMLN
ncbi:hypothetical protein K0M31_009961 [Melipona bicolor]|uniref:Uncharacterized protein n=1 Tax=Melipona bicolor TaxID=60889 RepID=A0AA40FN21_9HYME|nr:hypothetical protein K0M31_009961 [Melipona bicolor]